MMNNNYFTGIVTVVLGAACVYLGFKVQSLEKEVKQTKETLDNTVNEVSKGIDIPVSESFIRSCVNQAVDREVGSRVRSIANDAASQAKFEIRQDVKKIVGDSIDEAYGDTKQLVKDELKRQIDHLSIESIKKEVLTEAKKEAADRFKNDLDDILAKHNQELDKVTEIYSSIAKSMRGGDK